MRLTLLAAFACLFVSTLATNHTGCYNYFLKKDRCIFNSNDQRTRCHPKSKPPHPVHKVVRAHKIADRSLHRRYTTTNKSFYLDSGAGICAPYNSTEYLGVCLWSGPSNQTDPPIIRNSGWLNGAKTSNCFKQVYVQRPGNKTSVQYPRIIDGCDFGLYHNDTGCFQIGLTEKLFNLLANDTEKAAGAIPELIWDFDNPGNKPSFAPV